MTFAALGHILPELILLVGACALLVLGVTRAGRAPGALAGATCGVCAAALAATLWAGIPDGTAELPGLTLSAMTFYVRWLTLLVGLLLVLLNWRQADPAEQGEYLSLLLFTMLGVLLTASASDVVVLFFAIELVSVPTYVLVALSRRDARASEAAVKYFFLGALSAALLAYGLGFLYGAAGSTSLPAMARAIGSGAEVSGLALIGLLLVIGGLSFKIAAVPFHAYAADVYEGAAAPVTALLGFIPKFAGFVALIRVLDVFGWAMSPGVFWLIWATAALTMTVGNVLGLIQKNVKRMLAYSSIAHSGYMLVALLVGPRLGEGPMSNGVTALLFYMAVYGVMNLGAFAALSSFRRGEDEVELVEDLSGLARSQPGAALALCVCLFSLMGFPPTAGFLGKVYIFSGAFSVGADHAYAGALAVLAVIGVLNSAVAAAYYLRVAAVCWVSPERERLAPASGMSGRLGLTIAAVAMIALFVSPQALLSKARTASEPVLSGRVAKGVSRLGLDGASVPSGISAEGYVALSE